MGSCLLWVRKIPRTFTKFSRFIFQEGSTLVHQRYGKMKRETVTQPHRGELTGKRGGWDGERRSADTGWQAGPVVVRTVALMVVRLVNTSVEGGLVMDGGPADCGAVRVMEVVGPPVSPCRRGCQTSVRCGR